MIAYDDKGNVPFSGHKQGYLSSNIVRDRGNLTGKFMRDDLMTGYPAAVKVLKSLLLAGLETSCFSMHLLYDLSPFESTLYGWFLFSIVSEGCQFFPESQFKITGWSISLFAQDDLCDIPVFF